MRSIADRDACHAGSTQMDCLNFSRTSSAESTGLRTGAAQRTTTAVASARRFDGIVSVGTSCQCPGRSLACSSLVKPPDRCIATTARASKVSASLMIRRFSGSTSACDPGCPGSQTTVARPVKRQPDSLNYRPSGGLSEIGLPASLRQRRTAHTRRPTSSPLQDKGASHSAEVDGC